MASRPFTKVIFRIFLSLLPSLAIADINPWSDLPMVGTPKMRQDLISFVSTSVPAASGKTVNCDPIISLYIQQKTVIAGRCEFGDQIALYCIKDAAKQLGGVASLDLSDGYTLESHLRMLIDQSCTSTK